MSNNGKKQSRFIVNWETHPKNLVRSMCSLMQHKVLVDVLLCCGNNAVQAHKFVLAANSTLFREEFEKNPSVQQVVMSGCEFAILKNVLELMYCGQTLVKGDNVKFLIALVKLFEMKNLENMFADYASNVDDMHLPKPQFISNKPKFPAFAYQLPIASPNVASAAATGAAAQQQQPSDSAQFAEGMPPVVGNVLKGPANFAAPKMIPLARGTKILKLQAENQACIKEAQASRMALASLQKEIAQAPQVNSFIIEDACTETTFENFIPHVETSNVQVLNYGSIVDQGVENAVFVPLTVNQNDGIQYQVMDENGCVSEVQQLQLLKNSDSEDNLEDITKQRVNVGDFLNDTDTCNLTVTNGFVLPSDEEIPINTNTIPIIDLSNVESVKDSPEIDFKFPASIFFANMPSNGSNTEDDVFIETV